MGNDRARRARLWDIWPPPTSHRVIDPHRNEFVFPVIFRHDTAASEASLDRNKRRRLLRGRKKKAHEQLHDLSAILDLGLKWEFPTFPLTFIPWQMLLFDISVTSLEAKFWQKRLPRFPTSKFESSERETAILRETLQACERNWKALTVVTVN